MPSCFQSAFKIKLIPENSSKNQAIVNACELINHRCNPLSIDTYLSIKLLPSSSSLTTWIARSCEVTIDAICYFRHMKSWQLFYHFWRNVFIITFLLSYLFSIHDDGLFVAKVSRNQIDLIYLIRLIWKGKEIIIWFFIKTYIGYKPNFTSVDI